MGCPVAYPTVHPMGLRTSAFVIWGGKPTPSHDDDNDDMGGMPRKRPHQVPFYDLVPPREDFS